MSVQYFFELIGQQPPAPGQDNAVRSGANRDTSAYTAQSYSNAGGMEQYNQLPPLQRSIIKFIIDNTKGDEGVHVAAILRALNTDRSKIEYVTMFCNPVRLIPLHQCRYRKVTWRGAYIHYAWWFTFQSVAVNLSLCTHVCVGVLRKRSSDALSNNLNTNPEIMIMFHTKPFSATSVTYGYDENNICTLLTAPYNGFGHTKVRFCLTWRTAAV